LECLIKVEDNNNMLNYFSPKAIREARENLPSEPLESEDTVNIRLRGPDGQVTRRTFYIGDSTQVLLNDVLSLSLSLPLSLSLDTYT